MTWTKAKADNEYRRRDPATKQFVGYDRSWLFDTHFRMLAECYIDNLGLKSGVDRVALIGAAFGWSVEHLIARGIEAIGVEPSTEIHSLKNTTAGYTALAPLVKENSRNQGSRNRVKGAFSSPPNVIIAENVAPDLSDAEILDLLPRLEDYGGIIAHYVTPFFDSGFSRQKINHPDLNWKTKQEWRAFLPPDHILICQYRIVV